MLWDRGRARYQNGLSGSDTTEDILKFVPQLTQTETEPLDLPPAMLHAFGNVKRRTKPRAWSYFWQTVANGRSCREVAKELGAGYSTVKTKATYVRHDIVREHASLMSARVGPDGKRPWEKILPDVTLAELADGDDWCR